MGQGQKLTLPYFSGWPHSLLTHNSKGREGYKTYNDLKKTYKTSLRIKASIPKESSCTILTKDIYIYSLILKSVCEC